MLSISLQRYLARYYVVCTRGTPLPKHCGEMAWKIVFILIQINRQWKYLMHDCIRVLYRHVLANNDRLFYDHVLLDVYTYRILLSCIPDFPRQRYGSYKKTLLMMACALDDIGLVKLLLQDPMINTCINLADSSGCTALMHGAFCSNSTILKLLLENSAVELNKWSGVGWDALRYAVIVRRIDNVTLLLADPRFNIASIYIQGRDGYSALTHASPDMQAIMLSYDK